MLIIFACDNGTTDDTDSASEEPGYQVVDNDIDPTITQADLDFTLNENAIKLVNSWGEEGTWENVADGSYWISYSALKTIQPRVCFYENNYDYVYQPRMLAVFKINHDDRSQAIITIGTDDDINNNDAKKLQADYGEIRSGSLPFTDVNGNYVTMVLDISELIPDIYGETKKDVYLRIYNTGNAGTVESFSIEYYSNYSQSPFKTITGEKGSFSANTFTTFKAETANALSSSEIAKIQPLTRAIYKSESIFVTEYPTEAELQEDIEKYGVYQEGGNYNIITEEGFGTGFLPPTEDELRATKKLRSINLPPTRSTPPKGVDLTTTKYFPPIGNQGNNGSCTAFTSAYYLHTFAEAREHDWDISAASWESSVNPFNPGQPVAAYHDKIISPFFVYNQINKGGSGSSFENAMGLICRIGASSWEKMPLIIDDSSGIPTVDSTSWPTEAAFREAAAYRGRVPSTFTEGASVNSYGFGCFYIVDDDDIELLKKILAAGYCVATSVLASNSGDYTKMYNYLDVNDVIYSYPSQVPLSVTNHANTIVGYLEVD